MRQESSSSKRRRKKASTLFPYTTLFRSRSAAFSSGTESVRYRISLLCSSPAVQHYESLRFAMIDEDKSEQEDRKSTRLNSSHRTISYAVFCLKKKMKDDYEADGKSGGGR